MLPSPMPSLPWQSVHPSWKPCAPYLSHGLTSEPHIVCASAARAGTVQRARKMNASRRGTALLHLDDHLHAGMDRALDLDVAGLVEGDRLRPALPVRAQVEGLRRRQAEHVVEERVEVREAHGVAHLD